MCQLTYSNLHDPYHNALMVYFLSTIGSVRHDDGCGFITSKCEIWKSEKEAGKILNLGEILDHHILDNSPVPFHIRMATFGIEVTKENAHPFDGKHFILMHNGTLLPRNGEETKDKKHDSDSLKFLKALDECRDINPTGSFEEVFNGAMANFAGKFAFIIREKETKTDYIVRGRTAELWKTEIKENDTVIGYVINTSDVTLKDALLQFCNVSSIMTGNKYEWSTPVLLKMETIFVAEDMNVVESGKALEITPMKKEEKRNEIVPLVSEIRERGERRGGNNLTPKVSSTSDLGKIIRAADKIYEFLHSHSMGFLDLQIMFKLMGNLSLLECSIEDFDMFVDFMIPKLSATKTLRIQVNKLLEGKQFPNEVYGQAKLGYPWTVNDGAKVLNALKEWKG
jgi:predicted glutamine amidotransferase